MKNLEGRFAIVTGAARGIGAAIVKKFLEEGAAGVALWDINEEQLNETANLLDPDRKRTIVVPCNVANQEDVKKAVKTTNDAFGTIDILVNNAGITRDSMFHKMSLEQWKAVIDVNLNSAFYICSEVVPIMREKQYGKIVNISSNSANGNIGQANYSSTKAGIIGFTKTLARELGPKQVNVNAVAPGFIATEMVKAVPEEIQEGWKKANPMRRLGTPEELANVVCFLCSDDSAWINGECINANGGGVL